MKNIFVVLAVIFLSLKAQVFADMTVYNKHAWVDADPYTKILLYENIYDFQFYQEGNDTIIIFELTNGKYVKCTAPTTTFDSFNAKFQLYKGL